MNINKINKFTFNIFLLMVLSFASESNSIPILSSFISNINRKIDNQGWRWNFNIIRYALKNGKDKIGKIGYKCFKKIEEKPKESFLIGTGVATIGFLTWLYYKKYKKNKKSVAHPINSNYQKEISKKNPIQIDFDDWKKISIQDLANLKEKQNLANLKEKEEKEEIIKFKNEIVKQELIQEKIQNDLIEERIKKQTQNDLIKKKGKKTKSGKKNLKAIILII